MVETKILAKYWSGDDLQVTHPLGRARRRWDQVYIKEYIASEVIQNVFDGGF
jgi:hypothetical protein